MAIRWNSRSARKPAWASFDTATGRLWGTPEAEDVGNFTNIGISVSDGKDFGRACRTFDITVNQIALGLGHVVLEAADRECRTDRP